MKKNLFLILCLFFILPSMMATAVLEEFAPYYLQKDTPYIVIEAHEAGREIKLINVAGSDTTDNRWESQAWKVTIHYDSVFAEDENSQVVELFDLIIEKYWYVIVPKTGEPAAETKAQEFYEQFDLLSGDQVVLDKNGMLLLNNVVVEEEGRVNTYYFTHFATIKRPWDPLFPWERISGRVNRPLE